MTYDPNIHHRHSIRLKGYDYSQEGLYFITICVQDRVCLFGNVGAPLVGAQHNNDFQYNNDPQYNNDVQIGRPQGHAPTRAQNDDDAQNNVNAPNMGVQNDDGSLDDDGQNGLLDINGRPEIGRPQGHAPTGDRHDDVPIMILNDAGKMIETEWLKLTERFRNIELHEYVVMPNHFHGILQIVDVSSMGKTVGDMVDAFKSITTVEYIHGVKTLGWDQFNRKLWQRNYHEHIIRDEQSYQRISDYIINNPTKWQDDKFYMQ